MYQQLSIEKASLYVIFARFQIWTLFLTSRIDLTDLYSIHLHRNNSHTNSNSNRCIICFFAVAGKNTCRIGHLKPVELCNRCYHKLSIIQGPGTVSLARGLLKRLRKNHKDRRHFQQQQHPSCFSFLQKVFTLSTY